MLYTPSNLHKMSSYNAKQIHKADTRPSVGEGMEKSELSRHCGG